MQKILKKFLSFKPVILFFVIILFAVVLCTGKFSYAVTNGIILFSSFLLPTLFPYAFLTALLSDNPYTYKFFNKFGAIPEKLFKAKKETAYPFFLSLICGYPIGAKVLSDLKLNGKTDDVSFYRGSVFCSAPSPSFVIGSVGYFMFGDLYFGIILYLTTFLSVILSGIICSFLFGKKSDFTHKEKPEIQGEFSFYDTVGKTVQSALTVGGIIVLFYLLTEMVFSVPLLNNLPVFVKGILSGLFECTIGLKNVALCGKTFITLPTCAFLCSFAGLSVIMQSLAFLKKAKIKTAYFITGKVIQAVSSFIIGLILSLFLFI